MVACAPLLLVAVALVAHASAFYVPGVAPVEFQRGQKIDVKAVKMTSTHTQLPYEYYSLQFCLPKNGTLVYKSENLGEVLRGDRIVNTVRTNKDFLRCLFLKLNLNCFELSHTRCAWPRTSTANSCATLATVP